MRRKWIFSIIRFILAIIASIVFPIINMNHYFDAWCSESKESYSFVEHDIFYSNDKKIDLRAICRGRLFRDVICVVDNRIYFTYSIVNEEHTYDDLAWCVASISLDGSELRDCCMFEFSNPQKYYYCGGLLTDDDSCLYMDKKIILRCSEGSIIYDIETGKTDHINDEYFNTNYDCEISDYEKITITNHQTGETKIVTLESMALKNKYANKLFSLSSKHIWNGDSQTSKFFYDVRIYDDDIYIYGCVLNYNGESFAVVFKYDFVNDEFYYISSKKIGGTIYYYVIPIE